jgi:release factor glutamine methyltransferase
MFAKMIIKEQYRFFLQQLQIIYNRNEATVITDWVFESLTGITRFDILKQPDQVLSDTDAAKLNYALTALSQHKPVQYVLGEAWFYNMKLNVNENVLIPRPETEELVQLVLTEVTNIKKTSVTILDIGTGSGCIAIATKKIIPSANVTAIDVSEQALLIAKENAANQHTAIQFLKVDFLEEAQ